MLFFDASSKKTARRFVSLLVVCVHLIISADNGRTEPISYLAPASSMISSVRQPQVVLSFFGPWIILLMVLSNGGCASVAPKLGITLLTEDIRTGIQREEEGNSYDIVAKADERNEYIDELLKEGHTRAQIADILKLEGTAKSLFIAYGVIVEGGKAEEDFKYIEGFFGRMLPEHVEGLRAMILGVSYSRIHDSTARGRYYPFDTGIISFRFSHFGEGGLEEANLAHELGHFVQWEKGGFGNNLAFWAYHLLLSWGSSNYASEYGEKNHWEEWAEFYEQWVVDSPKLIEKLRGSGMVMRNKALIVIRKFGVRRDGKWFFRLFKDKAFEDVGLDIEDLEDLRFEDLLRLQERMKLGKPVSQCPSDDFPRCLAETSL